MEIIRKKNILITTERKFVVSTTENETDIGCEKCSEPMIRAQTAADLFGISSREIYRLIESERIHFVETATDEIFVCTGLLGQISEAQANTKFIKS